MQNVWNSQMINDLFEKFGKLYELLYFPVRKKSLFLTVFNC